MAGTLTAGRSLSLCDVNDGITPVNTSVTVRTGNISGTTSDSTYICVSVFR